MSLVKEPTYLFGMPTKHKPSENSYGNHGNFRCYINPHPAPYSVILVEIQNGTYVFDISHTAAILWDIGDKLITTMRMRWSFRGLARLGSEPNRLC